MTRGSRHFEFQLRLGHPLPYDGLTDSYGALQRWADKRGLALGDPLCHVYQVSPAQTREVQQLRTEVQWTVAATPAR